MGIAFGIMQLSCIKSELLIFQRFSKNYLHMRPPSWISGDNIDAIIVRLCSPVISRKSEQGNLVSSMRF